MSQLLAAIEAASQGDITPQFAGQRQLDYELIDSKVDDSEIIAVLQATTYISWSKLVSLLTSAINSFLVDYEGAFYLALNTDKFSSDLLLTCVVWPLIRSRVIDIIDLETTEPVPNANILLIDDFILTGQRVVGVIDVFLYESKRTDVNFYVCVAAVTPFALTTLKEFDIHYYFGEQLSYIEVDPDLSNKLSFDLLNATVAMYADHKISNVMINTPYLYHFGLAPNLNIGCLITYPPDEALKLRIWKQHFSHLMSTPSIYHYDI